MDGIPLFLVATYIAKYRVYAGTLTFLHLHKKDNIDKIFLEVLFVYQCWKFLRILLELNTKRKY